MHVWREAFLPFGLASYDMVATSRFKSRLGMLDVIRWDENDDLRRDAVRNQVIDELEAKR